MIDMSKTTERNKGTELEGDEIDRSDVFEEVEAKRGNITYTYRIRELLAKIELDESPSFTIYKFENPLQGDDKAFIAKFTQENPPDEDFIGREYGSGSYMRMMIAPAKKIEHDLCRVYKFRVHSRYDKIAFPQPAGSIPQQQFFQPQKDSTLQAIEMFERLTRSMLPLLVRQQDPDMKALMFQNFKDTGDILKKQQMDMIRSFSALRDQGEDVANTVEEKNEPSIIEQFAPIIKHFLPLLLGGGKKAEAVSTLARATPQFAAVIKDRGMFKKLVKHLDDTRGKEDTDKAL